MKKTIALLFALALLLCGCAADGGQAGKERITQQEDDPPSSTEVASETTVKPTEIGASLSEYDPSPITWGPGNIKDHKRPTDPVTLQEKYSELGGKWLLEDGKKICLTFDEGYENGYTPQILDTLKEKNIKAVFFCTYDYVKRNPQIVKRMIDEGHTVGNHSYRHYNMTTVDLGTARDEITLLHDYVEKNFGYQMKYFRFPEGAFSAQTLALANSLGYETIFWSFAYADWDTSAPPDPTEAFNLITSSVHNGAVILLHAVSKTNADILGSVTDNIREQGYVFTTELS